MSSQPIAIVGLGAVLPGAMSLSQYWSNLVQQVDCCREVPAERWIVDPNEVHRYPAGHDQVASRRACLVDPFTLDRAGLDLDWDTLGELDPLYLMALQAAREAWLDAQVAQVDRSRVGVILAAIALPTEGSSALTWQQYGNTLKSHFARLHGRTAAPDPLLPVNSFNRHVTALPAAIVARALGLGGGCYTLDAACASSLYAFKLACDELLSGRVDAMLAGGVSRPDCLYTQMGFTALGALSPSGRCSPFDVRGDGLVVGEGSGLLLLKRLSDAEAQGDRIYGVIRSIGLSNDIGGSLLAPDMEGQLRAMHSAYKGAGWSPTEVQLVECHGTGTPMGDRVEVNSLRELWKGLDWKPAQCGIGSVKSQIGHLLTAAGAAGMIKVLLGMQNETLPPSIHFSAPHANIPLPNSPFRVQTQAEPWHAPSTRKAAVSAFGFGGINAHVLVEEYRKEKRVWPVCSPEPAEPVAIVGLAARVGAAGDFQTWMEKVLLGQSLIVEAPPQRWHGMEGAPAGAYVESFDMPVGGFKLPPKDIPCVLPQQSLMLAVAGAAAQDAGLRRGQRKERMGALIGINLDMDTTDFHMRWALTQAVARWSRELGVDDPEDLERMRNVAAPPLDPTRTLGALGSIVASRVAREMSCGGPSFAISAEETSGLKALEVALRAIQCGELDAAIVGAVDLAGDPRSVRHALNQVGECHPFDPRSEGSLVGEGAVAIVLKRLKDCTEQDKVYAVIRGYGTATGGGVDRPSVAPDAQALAVARAYGECGLHPRNVTCVEAHASGQPEQDMQELAFLSAWYGGAGEEPCALSVLSSQSGMTGACAGLLQLAKSSACLYRQMLAPVLGFTTPVGDLSMSRLHVPIAPSNWVRDAALGPRRSAVHSLGKDGNCVHVVLEEGQSGLQALPFDAGLFCLSGASRAEVLEQGRSLREHLRGPQGGARGGEAQSPPSTSSLEQLARSWHDRTRERDQRERAVLVGTQGSALDATLQHLDVLLKQPCRGQGGLFYSPEPVRTGQVAFVFPGSGNHYAGMGREMALAYPAQMAQLDRDSDALASYSAAPWTVPYRQHWHDGWAKESADAIASDLHRGILGQVMYGTLASEIMRSFGVHPQAAIGYSLGESASLIALKAWPDRREIYTRMENSDLFRTQLGGECLAVRKGFGVPAMSSFEWTVAVLKRSAPEVTPFLAQYPWTALLIVTTDSECVVGGDGPQLRQLVAELGCEAFYLEGIPAVHCKALEPIKEEYYALHLLPTSSQPGLRFYSSNWCKAYEMSSDAAARAIVDQALYGLDWPRVIRQAYDDGVRFFLEMGPGSSCSRMIAQILEGRPHMVRSISSKSEPEPVNVLKMLAALLADHFPGLAVDQIYPAMVEPTVKQSAVITVRPGELLPQVSKPLEFVPAARVVTPPIPEAPARPVVFVKKEITPMPNPVAPPSDALHSSILQANTATAAAHETYLRFARQGVEQLGQLLAVQMQLLGSGPVTAPESAPAARFHPFHDTNYAPIVPVHKPCWLDYHQCMEFAVGSIGKVLGPKFGVVDSYPTRVRLPDDPLMLVHRMTEVEGEPGSMTGGRLVTEHDVYPGAWYLDNGRMPVCITVESGQADLFLSGYLGIDLQTKGERTYRLLDATVSFHRRLPTVGETISYDIRIDRFVRQGDTYLFFFEFDGTINGEPMITMREGCAGFFADAEIRGSKGIILTDDENRPGQGKVTGGYRALAPFAGTEAYSDAQIAALREADLAGCFGPTFANLGLVNQPCLPSGRLKLFDRVLEVDPKGGRFSLGSVRAEADIHPDDWFLTCHFVDDMVMPGTLMYECCAHTLRFLLWRMGWVGESDVVTYEPLVGQPAILRCRGPVDVNTKKVVYEVDIKEIGYGPEPYVIADAMMYGDGKPIVRFVGMSLRVVGLSREELEARWPAVAPAALYDRESIMQFAYGKPSLAFGKPYEIFDSGRKIARLPRPPYAFMDRVVEVNQEPFVLQAGGWIEAHYDVPPQEWFYQANRQPSMAFAILLEVALQPCGWLAAYCGSALRSDKDLKFRNLGGTATLHEEVFSQGGTLVMRVRMSNVSEAGGMIIENFDMQVLQDGRMVYEGTTYFGFFSAEALANQVGVRDAKRYQPTPAEHKRAKRIPLARCHPYTPEDSAYDAGAAACLPAGALQMLDEVDVCVLDGGPKGLGYLHGTKNVNPDEWFFQAHFYMDPVMPGSLGLEAFMLLMKVAALERYPHLAATHRFECIAVGIPHTWGYRGQVVPANKLVEVEAYFTEVIDGPEPVLKADGFLVVDNKPIYQMTDFAIRLTRV